MLEFFLLGDGVHNFFLTFFRDSRWVRDAIPNRDELVHAEANTRSVSSVSGDLVIVIEFCLIVKFPDLIFFQKKIR